MQHPTSSDTRQNAQFTESTSPAGFRAMGGDR